MSTMGSTYGHDWPLELAGAHGRISAYRDTLVRADKALAVAYPYVNGVALDASNSAWRRETAVESLKTLNEAIDRIQAERVGEVSGAVLIYCKGARVLANAVGLGWFKCAACGELLRLVEL